MPTTCKSFNRFIYNSNRYTSESYKLCEKTNDTLIELKDGKIGIIKNICYYHSDDEKMKKICIFYEELTKVQKYFFSSKNVIVHNIEEYLMNKSLRVCEPQMILRPCFLMKIQNKNYIIHIPRGYYGD